jgi:DNA-binding response OmpR family regulator
MSKATILAIDDEKDLIELVRYNLEKEGFDVVPAMDGESGLQVALHHRPDVILLDLMLPGMDGLEVCRLLRADPRTKGIPLIMLTAKAGEADRVIGLELGADDYVTKPFSPRELVARIKAVLRRVSTHAAKGDVKSIGRVVIDPGRHELTCQGRLVELTATEFRILNVLAGNVGKVFSRDEIIDAVLGEEAAVMDRTVDVHVLSLRRKMGEFGRYIRTVRGVGYKLDAGTDEAIGDEAA